MSYHMKVNDLSSPGGLSINDGIFQELSSVKYTSLDHLAYLVNSTGRGALLVKADIKEAYRMIPVHPQDQLLLGVKWNDSYYVDRMLPFGLRSAPKIFSAVADGLQWILTQRGITNLLHYLDDFVFVAASVDQAVSHKSILVSSFQQLGVPLETSKLEGPTTCLTFLGIQVDTEALLLCLPEEKLSRLKQELSRCSLRKTITKRELQSLTGLLQFATKVIRPGRPFLRQLYAMQSIGSHPGHHIRLNAAARADIMWWYLFAEEWNGISMLWDSSTLLPEFNVFSDASGSWGCGAYWGFRWFHFSWTDHLQLLPIAVKELIPVVVAAALFGRQWKGHLIQFSVDNMAVVHVLNSTYSRDSHLMHLVRTLVFLAACFDFWFIAKYIEGKQTQEQSAHLDIRRLDQAVRQYYEAALTPSTHKTYRAAEHKYLTFCNNFSVSPLPTSENILCYFAACLGQEGLASSSIRTYLSGIRQIQLAAGFSDPLIDHMPQLHQVLKGIRVQAAQNGRSPRPHLPITPSILHKLHRVWLEDNPSFNNTMLWAAATTTFFSFCRSGNANLSSTLKSTYPSQTVRLGS